ncbi:MAG: hypothetical protein FWB95_09185 [Treponema sp.]|nr:hypothetical protein [Treponema sp.]
MLVEMNPRGNGACPFCSSTGNCHVQETLRETLDKFSSEDNPMELVIYSCPYFNEK